MWFNEILGIIIKETYFRQTCPNCDDQMKYLRKVKQGKLYTCYICYKSWLKIDENFVETKLETK